VSIVRNFKYFHQHKPLGCLNETTAEVLTLKAGIDGLLKQLMSFASGVKR